MQKARPGTGCLHSRYITSDSWVWVEELPPHAYQAASHEHEIGFEVPTRLPFTNILLSTSRIYEHLAHFHEHFAHLNGHRDGHHSRYLVTLKRDLDVFRRFNEKVARLESPRPNQLRLSLPLSLHKRPVPIDFGMPDWLDYQKLAASIYADFEKNAVVVHNDKVRGIDSGIDRQIDVSIRTAVAGHEILIIVQAKDLGRPADVNVVGEFKAVIEDVRAAKGVLICSGGFTEAALSYAKSLNIDLCTVHDAQTRKWAVDLRIPLLWVETTGDIAVEIEAVADTISHEEPTLGHDPRKWTFSLDGGNALTTLGDLLTKAWNSDPANQASGKSHRLELAQPGMRLTMSGSYSIPVHSMVCTYAVRRTEWLGTFSFSSCRGIFNRGTGTMLTKVALTDKDIPLKRDPSWVEVQDPQAVLANSTLMIRVDRGIGPDSFTFNRGQIGVEDGS
jgi:hypothetical protein